MAIILLFLVALLNLPGLFDDFKLNHKSILPIALNYDHHHEAVQEEITNRIVEYYFNNKEPTPNNHKNVTNVSNK